MRVMRNVFLLSVILLLLTAPFLALAQDNGEPPALPPPVEDGTIFDEVFFWLALLLLVLSSITGAVDIIKETVLFRLKDDQNNRLYRVSIFVIRAVIGGAVIATGGYLTTLVEGAPEVTSLLNEPLIILLSALALGIGAGGLHTLSEIVGSLTRRDEV
jgi:SNF family Na+-dependent transporter